MEKWIFKGTLIETFKINPGCLTNFLCFKSTKYVYNTLYNIPKTTTRYKLGSKIFQKISQRKKNSNSQTTKPLNWLFSTNDKSILSQFIAWKLHLSEYDYEIVYKQ